MLIEHTWTNFKSKFKLAYTFLREIQLATGGSIYDGVNTIIHHEYSKTIHTLSTYASEQYTLVANVVQINITILNKIK